MIVAPGTPPLKRLQGYLTHKKPPPPQGPPWEPMHGPAVGSYGEGGSYKRGTPVRGTPATDIRDNVTNFPF